MAESTGPDPTPPPEPGVPPPQPAPNTEEEGSSLGLPSNIAAAVACFFSVPGGLVFLALEKKDRFVRFHSMQAVISGAVALAFVFALKLLAAIFFCLPLLGWLISLIFFLAGAVVGLGFFVLWVVSIFKAWSGIEWEIPLLGPLARKQLLRFEADEL